MVWTGGRQGDLAPAIEAMFDQADALWPDRSKVSDGTLGDLAHASRTSDHNPKDPNPPGWVDAGDLTYDPAHGVDHFVLAEAIRLRRDRRVKYVIFFARIFKSYVDSAGRPAWAWQPYTGTNAHKQHMHVSVTPEGRDDTSPWFPTGPSIPLPEDDDDMTPDEFVTLLETDPRVDSAIKAKINQALTFGVTIPAGTDRIGGIIAGTLEQSRANGSALAALLARTSDVSAEDIAAAIPAVLAQQVADELHQRLAG